MFYLSGAIDMGCVLGQQLRSHQAHIDALEALDDEIERRYEALISNGGEMYPFDNNNFWEALQSCDLTFNDKTKLTDPTELGKEIIRCVTQYWKDCAWKEAEQSINSQRDDY